MQEIITTVTFRDMDELQEYVNMIGYIKFHENVFITCNLGANIRMVKKPDDKNMRDRETFIISYNNESDKWEMIEKYTNIVIDSDRDIVGLVNKYNCLR